MKNRLISASLYAAGRRMVRMYLSFQLKPDKAGNESGSPSDHIDGDGLMEEQDSPGDGKDGHSALNNRNDVKRNQFQGDGIEVKTKACDHAKAYDGDKAGKRRHHTG